MSTSGFQIKIKAQIDSDAHFSKDHMPIRTL